MKSKSEFTSVLIMVVLVLFLHLVRKYENLHISCRPRQLRYSVPMITNFINQLCISIRIPRFHFSNYPLLSRSTQIFDSNANILSSLFTNNKKLKAKLYLCISQIGS